MTDQDRAEIQTIVRTEIDELACAIADVLRPLYTEIAEMQKSLGLLIDGQALVEKALANLPPEVDDWWKRSDSD